MLASGVAGAAGLALLGGSAYAAGLLKLYEPPRLSRADVVGVWQDGAGGTLELAADGRATAHRLRDSVHGRCEGTGAWSLENTAPRGQELNLAGACATDWSIGGTPERPTLSFYVGDPDSGQRHTLRRSGEG
ncbi:hypothetical protein ADL22_00555 [Streptomyces sp. NRRL F-4489]|uniref:hypothetical protein n=1 Tax=Streptomyces sp. NRRL F-4489 TaxID=1609095 RepID=UPI00074646A6|nr:hypothetical protein [Streptomyces sp. NRRL F-4489]KUL55418.1 hypothetical protein ADL22_00555 [Streptomyces sp. NRRL F-4489]